MAITKKPVIVRQVYADDLVYEFFLIDSVISNYPLVSLDTEFPGTVVKGAKGIVRQANPVLNYLYMKANVDVTNIIQLGLTLSDADGNLPDFGTPYCYIWEFNFNDFDVDKDLCEEGSIEFLKRHGMDFLKNKAKGIASRDFAFLVLRSGILSRGLTWITFHGAYDFGYLLKILTQSPLPVDFDSFMSQLFCYFGPNIFDIKHTLKFFHLFGGLEAIAKRLRLTRLAGSSHQAGSDSLLTMQCFMELKLATLFESNKSHRVLPPLALYGLVSALG